MGDRTFTADEKIEYALKTALSGVATVDKGKDNK